MASLLVALVLAAASIKKGKASPTTDLRSCVQLEVPVSVDTTTTKWLQPRVDSNIDAIDWTVNVTTWSTPGAAQRVIAPVPINRTFSISAQLCVPSQKGTKASILQIGTQGLGFDKRSVGTISRWSSFDLSRKKSN